MSMKLLRDDVGRSEHWAASRGWLYAIRGSGAEPELLRVLSGRFFGVAVHLGRVYVAGTGPSADGHSATYCGFIMSFRSAAGRLSDLRQEVVGLDNGVHQICVAVQPDGITFLYALETHAQRISGFRVLADGRLHPMARVIRPFPAAVNAWWVANDRAYASMRDALPEYLHANALTYHDGLFYVMCPRLRSQLDESGLPCNDPAATSSVRVFSEEWELLREYELDKRFCHDAVILGHQLRFLAASNELCSLDLVTGQVDTLVRLFDTHDDRAVCRGLSVSENGDATFSTTIGPDGRTGCFLVRISGDDVTVTDLPTTDTDGWSLTQLVLIHAPDYNQASGVLRAACGVHQVRLMTPMVQQMQEQFGVYLIGLEQMYKCRAPPRPHDIPRTDDASTPDSLAEMLDPPDAWFRVGPGVRHPFVKNHNFIAYKETDDTLCPTMRLAHDRLIAIALQHGAERTSHMLVSLDQQGMGWHTNLDNQTTAERAFRVYMVRNTEGFGSSFFVYRHPYSGRIHAVPDRNGYVNVFDLRDAVSPLWHAVVCLRGRRVSCGTGMTRHVAERLLIPIPSV